MEPIADVEGQLGREEPGEAAAGREDEIESRGLFGNAACEIRIKGTAGELDIGPEAAGPLEQPFDLGRESHAVRQFRLLKLNVDDFRADQDLSTIPALADEIGQYHGPGRHEGGAALFGRVIGRQTMRQQITRAQTDLLRADRKMRSLLPGPAERGQG